MNCYGIYLAAGNSRRFGSNKLLQDIGGKPMFLWGLEVMTAVLSADRVIVVTQFEQIRQQAEKMGVTVVWNPDSSRGITSSLQLGLKQARRMAEKDRQDCAWLFQTADQPGITRESLDRLIKGFSQSGRTMACLGWDGSWYNPCLFSDSWYPQLMALSGDKGGKQLMREHPDQVLCVEAGSLRELTDIDEKKDACAMESFML